MIYDQLNDMFLKLEYYINNSDEGFIIIEVNEIPVRRYILSKLMKKYEAFTFDLFEYRRSEYLSELRSSSKRLFVFVNFENSYKSGEDIVKELNFSRDIFASLNVLVIFVIPTYVVDSIAYRSHSFWSYVSIRFKVDNIFANKLPFLFLTSEPITDNQLLFERSQLIQDQILEASNEDIDYFLNDLMIIEFSIGNFSASSMAASNLLNMGCKTQRHWKQHYNLSKFLCSNNNFREALKHAKDAVELYQNDFGKLDTNYLMVCLNYAICQLYYGRIFESLNFISPVFDSRDRISGTDIDMVYNLYSCLSYCCFSCGYFSKSQDYLKKIIKLTARERVYRMNIELYEQLSLVYCFEGDYSAARTTIEDAIYFANTQGDYLTSNRLFAYSRFLSERIEEER